MSRKAIYSVIGLLLISGACLIGLAASIIIRQPFSQPISLANTSTSTEIEPISQVSGTPTEMPILVSTATSNAIPTSPIFTATFTATVIPTQTATQKPTITSTPRATITNTVTSTSAPATLTPTSKNLGASKTPTPLLPSTSEEVIGPICSKTGISIYLLIGVGINNHGNQFTADVVRYALVNYSTGEVRIVSFAPDLIISSPLLKSFNIDEMTVRDFYNYAYNNISASDTEPDHTASNYLAQAIYEEFGIASDHYFSAHSDKFVSMINTTGGVPIDIPVAYRDFRPGPQTLNGTQVIDYVRYPDPDLSAQINRQNIVILSLKDNIANSSLFEAIPLLADQYKDAYYTDLALNDLIKLRCVLRSVPDSNVSFFDIGPTYTTSEPGIGLQPNIDQIRNFLETVVAFN
jgi:anionic cell wall polymer biosynthesis LytR-Cps2A-Psr (LCP) family protein